MAERQHRSRPREATQSRNPAEVERRNGENPEPRTTPFAWRATMEGWGKLRKEQRLKFWVSDFPPRRRNIWDRCSCRIGVTTITERFRCSRNDRGVGSEQWQRRKRSVLPPLQLSFSGTSIAKKKARLFSRFISWCSYSWKTYMSNTSPNKIGRPTSQLMDIHGDDWLRLSIWHCSALGNSLNLSESLFRKQKCSTCRVQNFKATNIAQSVFYRTRLKRTVLNKAPLRQIQQLNSQ